MKHIAAILASAVVFVLLAPSGKALGSINCSGNYCDVSTDSIEYRYFPNNVITMENYGVATDGGAKHIVFALVQAGAFDASEPDERGRTVSIASSNAVIETHNTAHATLIYRASQPSNIAFTMGAGVGVVPLGSTAIIGDSELLADMAVTEGRRIWKSADSVTVSTQPGDVLTFRIQGPAGGVGDMLASGDLGAEVDVRTVGPSIDSDLTAFRANATVAVDSISSDRASFSYSGLGSSSTFIVDLSSDLYEPLKENMVVMVGGQSLDRFDDTKVFLGSSGPGYIVAEGQDYAEMLVRPGSQSGTLIIEKAGFDPLLVAAVLSSVTVCAAAAVFLFRRKRN